jgi:hypothetical protein
MSAFGQKRERKTSALSELFHVRPRPDTASGEMAAQRCCAVGDCIVPKII